MLRGNTDIFHFFSLPFLGSIFLTPAYQGVLLQERIQQLWKMPRAKTLMEGRALSCPLSVAAVSKPHCFSYFIFLYLHSSRTRMWVTSWKCITEHGVGVSLETPPGTHVVLGSPSTGEIMKREKLKKVIK